VASGLDTISARDMVKALIRGERDPHTPAGLARGRMRTEHAELIEALTGAFDAHHGELARIMLDQVDALTRQIDRLTTRIDELIAAIPAAEAAAPDGNDPGDPATRALPAVQRLAEIPGLGQSGAQAILAEVGRCPNPPWSRSYFRSELA
jgi:transposase